MKTFIRDSTVRVNITFKDIDGNLLTPPAANVTFSYLPLGQGARTFQTYTLVQQTDLSWQYDWDSSVAEPGVIQGHATTVGNPQTATDDFSFRLKANHANRELVGDDVLDPGYII